MTNFLKSSEPMPPRLGIVVSVSIMGGIENIAVDELQLRSAALLHKNSVLLRKKHSSREIQKTAPGDPGTVITIAYSACRFHLGNTDLSPPISLKLAKTALEMTFSPQLVGIYGTVFLPLCQA